MLIKPKTLIILIIILIINFAKVSNFGKVCTPKSDISEKSEGNGEIQKVVERDFGEKRL